jgi:hypothetical protein
MGLPSAIALPILKLQMSHDECDAFLTETMGLDMSYRGFLKETNFSDFQMLDLHDVIFVDLDAERVSSSSLSLSQLHSYPPYPSSVLDLVFLESYRHCLN